MTTTILAVACPALACAGVSLAAFAVLASAARHSRWGSDRDGR